MSRLDKWLLDPFGGRWSGAGGAAPPAPWYQSILDTLAAAGGGNLWLHEVGIDTAVEQPVATWDDVTGTIAWEQAGASSLRPLRKTDGLLFDGIDDRLNAPADVTTWLARASGPYTVGIGTVTALSNATTVYWAATSGSTASIVNLTTQNVLGRTGGSTLFSTAVVDTGPVSSWVAIAGSGSNLAKRRISTAETLGSYGTQAAGIVNSTLGARRTTSASLFLNGKIAWAIVCPVALSSDDMLAIETTLAANGYPT